ncbi:MAG: fumarate hydratase [Candidatus Thermoplasmatota archaeon]|nr:fumarate hydratase [Candidatus Thermoplasmatota archaeon]
MVSEELIKTTVIELLKRAVIKLPSDVKEALEKAYKNEISDVAKMQLKAIIENIKLAEELELPMCQDTGIIIFYVTNPTPNTEKYLVAGVREATKLVPLRPNAVDPLTRKNPGDNVGERMPYINYRFSSDDFMEITAFPKGAGSENMSSLAMLTPAHGIKGIKEFILNTVLKAGSQPCPPTIVGVGIGGSADIAPKLAKEALLRAITTRHKDKEIAQLETELFEAINLLGIGPMGLGGKTTCLGVNIEYAYCHTASLPVAVNIQCWCARRATARIYGANRVEYV